MSLQQNKKQKFHPLPAPGDIVWCLFPEILGTPGPKKRPALVARVSESTHEVSVVYGTSQKTEKIYPTEILLAPSDKGFSASGLSHPTKFDVAVMVQLPFDSEWFGAAPGEKINSPVPKMGTLHISYMQAIEKALKNKK